MKINICAYSIFFLILFSACKTTTKDEEVVTIFDKGNNRIEKGIMLNGQRTGYWATYDTNYVLEFDIQYKNNKPNGKSTLYYNGNITTESEYLNGKSNGHYISYHKYPIKEAEGNVFMGKKVGKWRTYSTEGKLNKIIVFEKDTFKIILDNKLEDTIEE